MKTRSLMVCTSFAALSVATAAIGQSERMSPGVGGNGSGAPTSKEMVPPAGDMPPSRSEPGASGDALGRGGSAESRGGERPEAQDRTKPRDRSGDMTKSDKSERDGSASTGASEGSAGRDSPRAHDQTGKRSKDAADSKPTTNDGASSGASEGTSGSDAKPSGSVTRLSGETRTRVQSAFRSHKSGAVVKDIHINLSVGVSVPRAVTLYEVPEDVVVIVPAYRRYKYFVFDDKVVVVDPVTFAIVDILILA